MSSGSDFLHLGTAPPRAATAWLVTRVRDAVADGRLGAGTRLPPSRMLAADVGVSRGVVVEAYRRLADEGLVTGRAGAGTVVTQVLARRGPPSPVCSLRPLVDPAALDLSPGVPDLAAFPRAAWLQAQRLVLQRADARDLGYGDAAGSPLLRATLADWLGRMRGLRAQPADVIVVNGVAQSLALLARTLVRQGTTRIAVEDPGSRGAREELEYWGLITVPVRVDDDGVDVDQLARTGVRAVLLTPAHQFPTGVVLSPGRRRALLSWVADVDGLVIEDDYDAEHRYDRAPVPALQASAPDHVAHTGSTSKTLAPGMRLGWLVPPPRLYADLVAAKYAADLGSPALPQLALAELLANGHYDRHLRLVRSRQRARRDAVLEAVREHLPEATVGGVAAGLHLVLMLPGPADDTILAERARAAGVVVQPLSMHRVAPGPPGLVLGYAAHSPDRLRAAIATLAAAIRPALT